MPVLPISLYPGPYHIPDGTAGNVPAKGNIVKSTGTAPTNGPNLFIEELLFDAAVDWHVFFQDRMPEDYLSGGTLKIQVKPKSAQGAGADFQIKACIAAVSVGENIDSKAFPVPDTLLISVASDAAGVLREGSLALSATALDSLAAGDFYVVMFGRNADDAADDAVGEMALVALQLLVTI